MAMLQLFPVGRVRARILYYPTQKMAYYEVLISIYTREVFCFPSRRVYPHLLFLHG